MKQEHGRRLVRFPEPSWLILAVIALALALRLINLSGRPMWYDEAIAVLRAELPLESLVYGTVGEVQPVRPADVVRRGHRRPACRVAF